MLRPTFLTCALLSLLPSSAALASTPANQPRSTSPSGSRYTLVLVDARSNDELTEARDFIASQGGRIAVVLPPHAILGWMSTETADKVAGRHRIRAIHRSPVRTIAPEFRDRETRIAIGAFNDIASGESARRSRRRGEGGPKPLVDCSLPRPEMNRDEIIRSLRLMGADQTLRGLQSTPQPQFFSGSDTMDGNVVVSVFLIESAGGIDPNLYDWSQADQTTAISDVIEGLNWWVEQSKAFGLARPLRFTVLPMLPNNPACQTPYEPLLHEGRDANLWIQSIMNSLGAAGPDTFVNVASYNLVTRDRNRGDWAFSIFIAYNPPGSRTAFVDGRASWAYLGGPHTNVLFRTFTWPLSRVVAHEAGHIFFACDEYSQPGYQTCSCTCAPEVRPAAVNGNCEDASCNINSTACIMRINELALCPFTVAQIGWTGVIAPPAPATPLDLVATAASPTQVSLIWRDPSRGSSGAAEGFNIERRGGSSAEFSHIGVVGAADSPRYSDTTALPNTAYAYRVMAFNRSGTSPSYSAEASVITPATPPVLTVTTASMPDATVGVRFSHILTSLGGRPEYAWLAESGVLPPGLGLTQTGEMSGTPTTAGTYNFVVRVTDADGNIATKALSMTIKPTAPLAITIAALPRGSVGTTYSQNLGGSGGQTPYNWTIQSGSLPEGLALNQTAGAISGTPERAGSYSFVVKLTDSINESVTASFSIAVNPASQQLALETASLPDAVLGQSYSQTLRATGGNAPYRWSLKTGALPTGFALSESGVISGTPLAVGEAAFEVQVDDQSGQSASGELSIDVDPAPELTIVNQSALPLAAVGVPYRVELRASAGTEPYTWNKKKKKKVGGILPDGIALAADGVLSGTPTTQGIFNSTIRVTDAIGKLASKPFTIEVGPPPPPLDIRSAALPNALQGLPYSTSLDAAGGVAPYTWALEGGTLPDGLSMSPAGAITGRATTLGAVTFSVRVRDTLGTSSLKTLIIVVVPPPPPLAITTVSLPNTPAERQYTQTLGASGGVPPYAWSLASGSLGAGLNLSANGVISGTPPAAGTYVFAVRVTDAATQSVSRTLAIIVTPADKLSPFGSLETPDYNVTLNTIGTGTGWALDNVGVTAVEVQVDGVTVAQGVYGLARPDLAATWASYPNAGNSGFAFSFDTTKFINGAHRLGIRLFDASGNMTVLPTRPFQVQNQLLVINTRELTRGKKGEPYSVQLSASNGRAPYSWSLASGSLPQGLSLNLAGVISGTPSVFGTFSFTVRATDSTGAIALTSLTLLILPDVDPLAIVSRGDLAPGSTGVAYSYQLLFIGGRAPRTWAINSGSLPAGLSLGAATGVISGTPTQVGAFNFTVRLTDATPSTATSDTLRIVVGPGPLSIGSSGNLPSGRVNVAYSYQLLKAGGASPYTWELASGALPAGLSLNATTGVIAGRPTTDGTFTFTVQLTDSQPVSVTSATLRIVVDFAPLAIVSAGDLTGGRVGVAYTHQLVSSGGRPPATWALASGVSLPPGLTLNATTGVISGSPTQRGNFTFRVTATDATPTSVTSADLRITISP